MRLLLIFNMNSFEIFEMLRCRRGRFSCRVCDVNIGILLIIGIFMRSVSFVRRIEFVFLAFVCF